MTDEIYGFKTCPDWSWQLEPGYQAKKDQNNAQYELLGQSIGALVQEKQDAYGDAFGRAGEVLKILYPNGIGLDKYDDMLTIARIIDKLFRIATRKGAFGESPYRDIAGYGLLGAAKDGEATK